MEDMQKRPSFPEETSLKFGADIHRVAAYLEAQAQQYEQLKALRQD